MSGLNPQLWKVCVWVWGILGSRGWTLVSGVLGYCFGADSHSGCESSSCTIYWSHYFDQKSLFWLLQDTNIIFVCLCTFCQPRPRSAITTAAAWVKPEHRISEKLAFVRFPTQINELWRSTAFDVCTNTIELPAILSSKNSWSSIPSLQLQQGQLVLSMTNNAVFWLRIVPASKELLCKLEVHVWLAAALDFCSAYFYRLDWLWILQLNFFSVTVSGEGAKPQSFNWSLHCQCKIQG